MDREPREHPLLMRPELVRATLAGRKTQTRRLVTPGTSVVIGWPSGRAIWPRLCFDRAAPATLHMPDGSSLPLLVVPIGPGEHEGESLVVRPRVRPGDRLWVREAWQTGASIDHYSPARIGQAAHDAGFHSVWAPVRYTADGATKVESELDGFGGAWGRTRIGMHMPRWACRLVLGVEAVRAERVQAISEDDAQAEGVEPTDGAMAWGWTPKRHAFAVLWDKINAARAPWSANPWTWAYQWPAVQP